MIKRNLKLFTVLIYLIGAIGNTYSSTWNWSFSGGYNSFGGGTNSSGNVDLRQFTNGAGAPWVYGDLYSPAINIQACPFYYNYNITFNIMGGSNNNVYNMGYSVYYSIDNGATWFFLSSPGFGGNWSFINILIPAFENTTQIKFKLSFSAQCGISLGYPTNPTYVQNAWWQISDFNLVESPLSNIFTDSNILKVAAPTPYCINLSSVYSPNYNWSSGDTTQSIEACNSGIYSLDGDTLYGVLISDFNDSLYTPNGPVNAICQIGDNIYIGGNFDMLAQVTGGGVCVNSQSSKHYTSLPRVNGVIKDVVSDGNGGWYIGGYFTRMGPYKKKNLSHINPDGSVDQEFNPNPNDTVYSIFINNDNLYIGGQFTSIGGSNRSYIASVSKHTGNCNAWEPYSNGPVKSVLVYGDKVFVGGVFTNIGGQTRNYLAQLDTLFGMAQSWNPNPNAVVNRLRLFGNKLYVLGDFTQISNQTRNYLASYTASTVALDVWNPNPNGKICDVYAKSGQVFIGGAFTNIGSQPRNFLASLSQSSGTATSWNPYVNGSVGSFRNIGDDLYLGGEFDTIDSNPRKYLAAINMTSGLVLPWNPVLAAFKGKNVVVNCLTAFNSVVYIGGNFFGIAPVGRNNLAAIKASTGEILNWNPNINCTVRCIVADNNYIYAGGDFTQVNGWYTRNYIAQINRLTGVAAGWNPNANGKVYAMALKGQSLFVGGDFSQIGGAARQKLATISTNDGLATSWIPNPNGGVRALVIGGDSIYVGGAFTSISGVSRKNLASYNIQNSSITNLNPLPNDSILCLAYCDGKIAAGGKFYRVNTSDLSSLLVINVNTNTIDSDYLYAFKGPLSKNALAFTDNVLYTGGNNSLAYNPLIHPEYFNYDNLTGINLGTIETSIWWHSLPNNTVRTIVPNNEKLWVGGDFTEVLGIYQPFFVWIGNFSTIDAKLDTPNTTTFCAGDLVPLHATSGNGYTYQWFKNGSLVPGATTNPYYPQETGYYKALITDNIGYCSLFTNAILINVIPYADTVITASGPTSFCGGNVTLNAEQNSLYTYVWYKNDIIINGANQSSLLVDASGNYYCEISNSAGCIVNSQHVLVNANAGPPPASSINGITEVCQGQSNVIYTINPIAGASSYIWTLPAGFNGISSTNSITISMAANSNSGTISVVGQNTCGTGVSSSLSVIVSALPYSAGTISGPTQFCEGSQNVTYTVAPIPNATSYLWTLPNGLSGTSTSNSIQVNAGIGAFSGYITVKGQNDCGDSQSSSLLIEVVPALTAPTIITGPASICEGINNVTYSTPILSNASSYIWSFPTGFTGTSSTNSITVNVGIGAVSGNITVKGKNVCGDGPAFSWPIIVNQIPGSAGSITGSVNLCQGSVNNSYSILPVSNATTYIWMLPTGLIGTSISNSISINVAGTAISGAISVQGHNSCGDGVASNLTINIDPLPVQAGLISGPIQVCRGTNGNTYTINGIGNATSYIWTYTGTGATILNNGSFISVDFNAIATSGDLVVFGHNNCGDGQQSPSLPITVSPAPVAAGNISGSQTVCQGQSNVTFSIGPIQNAVSYVWSYSGTGATITNNGNSISVSFAANASSGYLTVYGHNLCGDGAISPSFAINVDPLPGIPGVISGTSTVCQGQSGISFSIPAITNAVSYHWSFPSGVNITSGAGTNNIGVDISNNANSGNITVYGINACGDGIVSATFPLSVNPLPGPAGSISGNSTVCQGQTSVIFNVQYISNATNYSWTLPVGANIVSGNNTNTITVDFNSVAVTGNISVYGVNSCGNGPASGVFPITVNPLPGVAGAIDGQDTVCQGSNSVQYWISQIPNATGYNWTLPSGATIVAGANTNTITVNFSTSATSGIIHVQGTNACGNGIISTPYAITVNPLPSAAGAINGSAIMCQGDTSTYSINNIINATAYDWTVPSGVVVISNTGTSLHLQFPNMGFYSLSVKGTNVCGNGAVSPPLTITVNPKPSPPVIFYNQGQLTSSSVTGNQWYCNGNLIPGATGQNYQPIQNGYYFAVVTINGCISDPSNSLTWTVGIEELSESLIKVYPNPSTGLFEISYIGKQEDFYTITITNSIGDIIKEIDNVLFIHNTQVIIDLQNEACGIYALILRGRTHQTIRKLMIHR